MSRHYLSELVVTATLGLTVLAGVPAGLRALVADMPLAPAADIAAIDADLGAIAVVIQRGYWAQPSRGGASAPGPVVAMCLEHGLSGCAR